MFEAENHINSSSPEDHPVSLILRGMDGVLRQEQTRIHQLEQECSLYRQQAESFALPQPSVVAEGKQNELIAVLNVLYEAGLIANCTKAEFMKRIADALGATAMANNYAKALYNIKLTYKYDEIFSKLNEVAQTEKKK